MKKGTLQSGFVEFSRSPNQIGPDARRAVKNEHMNTVDQTTGAGAHEGVIVRHGPGPRRLSRSVQRCCLVVALAALTACGSVQVLGPQGAGAATSESQFTRGRLDRVWAAAPGALVMAQRTVGGDGEQIIGLANDTTLEGDNFLWLRARSGRGRAIGNSLDMADLVTQAGGVPSPFRTLDNSNLRTGSDSLGPFFWQEYRSGAQTNCVLAVRRLNSGALSLPTGTRVLEVMLRNCVNGSIEEALSPIRDGQISRLTGQSGSDVTGGSRMLSSLAGPRP